VKPAPFDYLAPSSLDEALALVRERGDDGKLLAGGQSLIPVLNFRLAQPALLIDLNRLEELDFVEPAPGGGLRIGAMTRLGRLERAPEISSRVAPLLAMALPHIAHPQIRNRGTIGGSLAHADPAAELPAVMVALEATFELRRQGSVRRVSAGDFFIGLFASCLESDEILTAIELPPPKPSMGWAFLEEARRHGDYAQVGVAAGIEVDSDHICRGARLVFLSVGEGPMVAERAAASLIGQRLTPNVVAAAAAFAAAQEIEPASDIHASADFKRHLARVLTARALSAAASRASRF
jgi:aerobic carbon-monoxide dehydrogenase medium subunit